MTKTLRFSMLFLIALIVSVFIYGATCNKSGCCKNMKDIEVVSTKIDNGVKVTLTAKDAEGAKKLQEMVSTCSKECKCKKCNCPICGMKNAQKEFANTEKGVVITITSQKAGQVEEIQKQFNEGFTLGSCCESNKGCCSKQGKGCCSGKSMKSCGT
ncbi:MAG: hypothetical protein N2445_06820 [Acidobacteria bacterium]|nr:hypothetical protein [Acidobacteriota bacterium]